MDRHLVDARRVGHDDIVCREMFRETTVDHQSQGIALVQAVGQVAADPARRAGDQDALSRQRPGIAGAARLTFLN